MQILILLLAMGLFAHDAMLSLIQSDPRGWGVASVVGGPMLLMGGLFWILCRRSARNLTTQKLRHVEWWMAVYRFALMPWYVAQLWIGWLVFLRRELGDVILLDELGAMGPTLGLLAWSWWCYYPIGRQLREAMVMRRMDRGQVIYPIWTRGQYMLAQLRHQVLLLLVPLLAMVTWIETASVYIVPHLPADPAFIAELVVLSGSAIIFIFAPWMIRAVLDTVVLPDGEIRDRLIAMCNLHRVKVRQLLLWRTFGGSINAAVMGVFAPLRYIMITDALLERFPRDQVEAVMAHELAHVRKHHMFWLLLLGLTMAGVLDIAGQTIELYAGEIGVTLTLGVLWFYTFGWASRRMERQADGFAVAHLAREKDLTQVNNDAAGTMILALQQVADLNHISTTRRSWRHGSIRSRQDHLRNLIGQSLDRLSTDRAARQVNRVTLLLLAVVIVWHAAF